MSDVQQAFDIKNKSKISGRHILIVDDVLTTGTTVESSANLLLKNGASKISLAILAVTK